MKQTARGVMVFFGGIVVMAVALVFLPQWETHRNLEQELEKQREQKAQYEARLQDYRVRQQRFQTDRRYVKQVAHEIGMIQPDEIIFKFYEDRNSFAAAHAN